jgi:hypothetical protein
MTNPAIHTTQTEDSSFPIYVDLFDKGEFNEMNITCQSGNYHVNMDDMYLGTLSKNSDDSWEVVSGTIPSAFIPDITNNISRNLEFN